jgi:anti-sigma-K factor RskA
MTVNHPQDDLVPYALGELSGQELQRVRQHLSSCGECRQEVEQLILTLAVLGMAEAEPVSPSPKVRERLLKAVQPPPLSPPRKSLFALGWVPAFAMAILVIAGMLLATENLSLRRELREEISRAAIPKTPADVAGAVLSLPDAIRVTLKPAKFPPQPQATAVYSASKTNLVFTANNIAPPPVGKAYELWLLAAGGKPVPAGMFKPDAQGNASLVNPPLPSGLAAKGFAVTVEPEGGSEQPTSAILLVGTV